MYASGLTHSFNITRQFPCTRGLLSCACVYLYDISFPLWPNVCYTNMNKNANAAATNGTKKNQKHGCQTKSTKLQNRAFSARSSPKPPHGPALLFSENTREILVFIGFSELELPKCHPTMASPTVLYIYIYIYPSLSFSLSPPLSVLLFFFSFFFLSLSLSLSVSQ